MATSRDSNAIDLCGLSCPFVLAEIEDALVGDRETVEVICDHPTTVHDTVPAYCRQRGYELTTQPKIYPLDRQHFRLRISKRRPVRSGRDTGG